MASWVDDPVVESERALQTVDNDLGFGDPREDELPDLTVEETFPLPAGLCPPREPGRL